MHFSGTVVVEEEDKVMLVVLFLNFFRVKLDIQEKEDRW